MPKIKFSHIFLDKFERVYDFFAIVKLDISFENLISNLKFYKGERFDEENAEFSFCWKNYYEIRIVIDKVIKDGFFRSITGKSTYIDKLPIQISLTFNFFWDSINENTIFILELYYEEEFFTDLIKNDFNDGDKMKICDIIEKYLRNSLKGLESEYFCYLNASLNQAWKYLLYPNLFFKILSKDTIVIYKESEITIDETYELFAKTEDSPNPIPITVYIVSSIIICSNYAKVTYNTFKEISFPNIRLTFTLKELKDKKCLFSINIKPNEPTSYEMNSNVNKFWKKRMIEFFHFFEKNKKKNKLN